MGAKVLHTIGLFNVSNCEWFYGVDLFLNIAIFVAVLKKNHSYETMETVKVQGQIRSEINKKATKALRATGNIPCVMYGGKEVVHFEASPMSFKHAIYTHEF